MGRPKEPGHDGEAFDGLRNPYSLSTDDTPTLASRAEALGYRLRSSSYLTGDGWLHCRWLQWTDDALERQGFTATATDYFEAHATLPPALDFDVFAYSASQPLIGVVSGRQPVEHGDYAARYRAAALRLIGDDGLIRGEHVAELHARDAALWQRVGWDTTRLAADADVTGWLRVIYREAQIVYKRHAESGDHDKMRLIMSSWRHMRDFTIGRGAEIPSAMHWAKRMLDMQIGLDDEYLRAQLSGLAYILYHREPMILRLVEARDALDVNTPLLDAAVLNYPPLSDEAVDRASARRSSRVEAGDVPTGLRWTHIDFARLVVARYFATPEGEKRSWARAHDDEDDAQRGLGGSPFSGAESFQRSKARSTAEAEHWASQG